MSPGCSPLNRFIRSVFVTGCGTAQRRKECWSQQTVEHLQHLAAHAEGAQLPGEVESAAPLLVRGCAVGFLAQSVVDGHAKVLVLRHHLHDPSRDKQVCVGFL